MEEGAATLKRHRLLLKQTKVARFDGHERVDLAQRLRAALGEPDVVEEALLNETLEGGDLLGDGDGAHP